MLKSRMARVALLALVAAGATLLPAGPATAAQHTWDLTNPANTTCANDARTLAGYPKPIMYGTSQVGTYEIRYSPSCGTNWLRVNNWYPSGAAKVRMIFAREGGSGYRITDETANGAMWTPQLYAPGSTCIAYQVFVTTNGEPYASRGEINPGLPYTSVGGGTAYKQC